MYKALLFSLLALMLTGCVSLKEYRKTKGEMLSLKYSYDEMASQYDAIKARNATLEEEYNRLLNDDNSDSRTAELEALLKERDQILDQVRSALSDALIDFENQGLSLVQKGGRIYVMMDDKLLFESGKYNITKTGKNAIRKIGGVLSKLTNVDVVVEGHTDNKGLRERKDAQIVDNWDLSCKRATEVVRVLLTNDQISPARIVASGRGQYMPLANNSTEAGRGQNRRTEIALTPQLDKLLEIFK